MHNTFEPSLSSLAIDEPLTTVTPVTSALATFQATLSCESQGATVQSLQFDVVVHQCVGNTLAGVTSGATTYKYDVVATDPVLSFGDFIANNDDTNCPLILKSVNYMSNDQPYAGTNLVIDYAPNTITVSTAAVYVEEVNIGYETYSD